MTNLPGTVECGALVAIQQYIARIERQLSCKVKNIRSDNDGELSWSSGSNTCCHRVFNMLGSLQMLMRRINEWSQYILQSWTMSELFCSILNYCRILDLWTGNKTTLDHLYPVGCNLYYRHHQLTGKLQPRYKKGRLLDHVNGITHLQSVAYNNHTCCCNLRYCVCREWGLCKNIATYWMWTLQQWPKHPYAQATLRNTSRWQGRRSACITSSSNTTYRSSSIATTVTLITTLWKSAWHTHHLYLRK